MQQLLRGLFAANSLRPCVRLEIEGGGVPDPVVLPRPGISFSIYGIEEEGVLVKHLLFYCCVGGMSLLYHKRMN